MIEMAGDFTPLLEQPSLLTTLSDLYSETMFIIQASRLTHSKDYIGLSA
jgi:hypothetical protein